MQKFLARLFTRLMKSWNWVLLIVLTILIKWASWYPNWVEHNYSRGVYPVIAKVQRFLFGWLPFSIGDVFYGFLIIVIIYKVIKFFKLLFKRQLNRKYFVIALQQGIFILLFLYVFFNLLWGLNYNRRGIAYQLDLKVNTYTLKDLDTLTNVLQQRLNYYAGFATEAQRDSFNRKSRLFRSAVEAYAAVAKEYPFLKYKPKSITHEMAHQLGYGKENEANFVGFLACRAYNSNVFRYSAYYDAYNYAIGEVYRSDTTLAKSINENVHPQVKKDQKEFRDFFYKYRNPIEPIIMWGYGHFLKANNQPAGKRSYNEVVAWLIAFYKKNGVEAL